MSVQYECCRGSEEKGSHHAWSPHPNLCNTRHAGKGGFIWHYSMGYSCLPTRFPASSEGADDPTLWVVACRSRVVD